MSHTALVYKLRAVKNIGRGVIFHGVDRYSEWMDPFLGGEKASIWRPIFVAWAKANNVENYLIQRDGVLFMTHEDALMAYLAFV